MNIVVSNDGDTALVESEQWNEVIRVDREPTSSVAEFLRDFPIGEECPFTIERCTAEGNA